MAWTKEQETAIYKDGTNIIVSAGAGSGKTYSLVKLLENIQNEWGNKKWYLCR